MPEEDIILYKDVAQRAKNILQKAITEQEGGTLHLEDNGPALARTEAQKILDVLNEHLGMQTMEDIKEVLKKHYEEIPFIVCDEETPIGVWQQILEDLV